MATTLTNQNDIHDETSSSSSSSCPPELDKQRHTSYLNSTAS